MDPKRPPFFRFEEPGASGLRLARSTASPRSTGRQSIARWHTNHVRKDNNEKSASWLRLSAGYYEVRNENRAFNSWIRCRGFLRRDLRNGLPRLSSDAPAVWAGPVAHLAVGPALAERQGVGVPSSMMSVMSSTTHEWVDSVAFDCSSCASLGGVCLPGSGDTSGRCIIPQ